MASEVKTNKISPATGTDVTLGDTSDTFTVPSGATLAVASGATLNITGATKTGFPAGGLTAASQWRLTTDFTGNAAPIASNLEEVDAPVGFGVLGSSMTESSGIFTFPSTGYWMITFTCNWSTANDNTFLRALIYTTTNDATYAIASEGITWCAGTSLPGTAYAGGISSYIFDVTDTANCKCRFDVDIAAATVTTRGDSDENKTFMTFLRLADT